MTIINNLIFAKEQKTLSGTIDISEFKRVGHSDLGELSGEISYTLTGEMGAKNRAVLKLILYGKIRTLCQICLNPIELNISCDQDAIIFKDEMQLEQELSETHDTDVIDGIIADKNFNVLDFIEDEVIMLLPVSPKHETCSSSFNG